jgi:hypothetical protein
MIAAPNFIIELLATKLTRAVKNEMESQLERYRREAHGFKLDVM